MVISQERPFTGSKPGSLRIFDTQCLHRLRDNPGKPCPGTAKGNGKEPCSFFSVVVMSSPLAGTSPISYLSSNKNIPILGLHLHADLGVFCVRMKKKNTSAVKIVRSKISSKLILVIASCVWFQRSPYVAFSIFFRRASQPKPSTQPIMILSEAGVLTIGGNTSIPYQV